MSREKTDIILKVVVKHFLIEKEVTSTLVMDSLHSGLKALEGQTKNQKAKVKWLDTEEIPAPIVHVEKDMFVLVDYVLLLLERAVIEPLPPKGEKCPQNRTKLVDMCYTSCMSNLGILRAVKYMNMTLLAFQFWLKLAKCVEIGLPDISNLTSIFTGLDHFIPEPLGTKSNLADNEIFFSKSMMEFWGSPRQDLIVDRLSEFEKVFEKGSILDKMKKNQMIDKMKKHQ